MKKGCLIVVGVIVVLIVAMALCSGPSEKEPTATTPRSTATTEVAAAATKVEATSTPMPTATTIPTATPVPLPTNTPPPTPTPEPVIITGSGQTATDEFYLPAPVSIARFTHSGSRNFIVVYYQAGDEELLINEIGPYEGARPLAGDEPIMLDIDADGNWTVRIEPIGVAEAASFDGRGDAVSGLFTPPNDGAWEISHDGDANFIVLLHCAGGSDLVQNEIGVVSGSTVVKFATGPCFWEVKADGSWSLKPRQ